MLVTLQLAPTTAEIREGFEQMIAAARAAGDLDAVARMEIGREWFTNPQFRADLRELVWQMTQGKQ